MFIDWSLYMARRGLSLPGAPDLWIRLSWLQSSTQNGMKWGALTLPEISHSRGCYLKFAVLLVQRVCSPKRPNTKDPRLCALEAYIAGKEDKLLYPDHHLIRCTKSGFRPTHFPPLLCWSPTIVGGLQITLQSFFGLNPKLG